MTEERKSIQGHNGPYNTPIVLPSKKVLSEWIDYNGHMNVVFYTLAFDNSLDFFLEEILGIGKTHAIKEKQGPFVLQAHYHYLNEMGLNDEFNVRLLVVDCDKKRMHLCLDIFSKKQKHVIAVAEKVLINVNLNLRKVEHYPVWAYERLIKIKKTHEKTSFPNVLGKKISLKK